MRPGTAVGVRRVGAGRHGRQRRRAVIVVLLMLALTACGVPRDGTTRTVQSDKVPYNLLAPTPARSANPTVTDRPVTVPQLFFVDADDQLVPQAQPLAASGVEPVVRGLLQRLSAGPTELERGRGLSSALGPGVKLRLVGLSEGLATIEVSPSEPAPAADRLPVAVGQIVLTVASVDGVDFVRFVQHGVGIEAPLPGGARTAQPVGASDYVSLLAPSASRATKAKPGPSASGASP